VSEIAVGRARSDALPRRRTHARAVGLALVWTLVKAKRV
jgi:hypothetical protein